MQTERRWARGRNTRGLPVGVGEHMRGPGLTDRLNRQVRLRRDRLVKLARRVMPFFHCAAIPAPRAVNR